ncbi:hypothetical protein [Streptomyces sp. NEAU-NA10]|uniref:hypothetical protein n=1 Tax=Streptomyces sp. NEAU-NA10 TaxID=3416050 RepID=UPI003CC676AF
MITLHELFERGGETAAAALTFGGLHPDPDDGVPQQPVIDWKAAEQHFRQLQILIMADPKAPPGAGPREQERRAENAATDCLLYINAAGGRCPICQRRVLAG